MNELSTAEDQITSAPENVSKCRQCKAEYDRKIFQQELSVCPSCGRHDSLTAQQWIDHLADPDTFREIGKGLYSADPLEFSVMEPYRDRLREAEQQTGMHEAALSGEAKLDGRPPPKNFFK